MNPTSEDMKDRLEESAVALGTFGTDLFIGTMPPEPDTNVTLRDLPWKKAMLNYELKQPGMQALIRGAKGKYRNTMLKAEEVFDALSGYQGTINGTRYLLVEAVSSPAYLGEDESNRPLFSINFEVQRTTA